MFIDEKDLRSNFLQKKNKQKKKIQQNQQQIINAVKIQSNVRAFIMRKKLQGQVLRNGSILKLLFLSNQLKQVQGHKIEQVSRQLLKQSMNDEFQQNQRISKFYFKRLIFTLIKREQTTGLFYQLFTQMTLNRSSAILDQVLRNDKFYDIVNQLTRQKKGVRVLNLAMEGILEKGLVHKISKQQLLDLVFKEFKTHNMQQQSIHSEKFKTQTLLIIFDSFYDAGYNPVVTFGQFEPISSIIHTLLKTYDQKGVEAPLQPSLFYLISLLLLSFEQEHNSIIQSITLQYNHLLVLMEDEEDLQYFERKIINHEKMQVFSSVILKSMQQIFESQKIVSLFFDRTRTQSRLIKQVMIKSIKTLSMMFQDRQIIFLRSLLSSNQLLTQLLAKKNDQFYQGLKMRLLAMDDQQFKQFDLFSENQWKDIIHTAVTRSFRIIKAQVTNVNYAPRKVLVPFQAKNQENLTLNTLSQTIQSLYKKSLRTRKLNPLIFIQKDLSQAFNTFNFGMGALAMQRLLKLYPFAFTFESRLIKFKQLIRQDKLKHDRTLFLQEQVDSDLIIHVRRGKEFLDAYQSLVHKDLRRKYKLVFFNEQGLEEEGIDGGGLIKEFINRVLKSAFSQVYGLFYQTSQNQLVPNSYSPSNQEYEFIGKIIGKAVYEAITIQQKFVEPFLNLVIGRKNSFEDIQYIDQQIYRSLIQIKKMQIEDLEDLQQTFVILDQQPDGMKKYVNLLYPSKKVLGTESQNVFVTRQNKLQFIMAYSDFKCNKQLQEKTRSFRKGFLKVMKPQWLTLFNNQELNKIISGGQPNFDVKQLKQNCVYCDYHEKSISVLYFWQILAQFSVQQKSHFLLYVTSCSRPPTLGFGSMKPKVCISKDENETHLPTANTCMNVFRLPDYKNKQLMRNKILYAIYSKAGFQFA